MKTIKFLSTLLLLLIMACGNDDSNDGPENINSLLAVVDDMENESFTVGKTITLDGSKSKDKLGKPFEYLWRIKTKPNGSKSELSKETTKSPQFTPDKDGEYQVELKVYNKTHYDTDEVTLFIMKDPAPQEPIKESIVLKGIILNDSVLKNVFEDDTKIDYIVSEDIFVRAHLTIEPSVTIAFKKNTGMFVEGPGSITSKGTSNGNVIFTGVEKTPGFWKGLIVNSNGSANLLENTVVEYGGGLNARGMKLAANIALDGTTLSNLVMTNSITRYSGSYGLVAEPGTSIKFELANKIASNHKPASLAASQLGSLNGLLEFSTNDINIIEVLGTSVNSSEVTRWINPQDESGLGINRMPYLVMGKISVASEVQVSPNVEMIFNENAEIEILPTGSFSAVGTFDQKIRFKAKIDEKGQSWNGISFGSNSTKNRLKHVEVLGGGNNIMEQHTRKTAVGVRKGASVSISETEIDHSEGNGILVENEGNITELSFVLIQNAQESAIALTANSVENLNNSIALEFTGNGHDGVEIMASSLMKANNLESTWPALEFGATYLVSGNLALHTGLRLKPKTIFKMAEDGMIGVFANAYLNAVGNPSQEIVFRGKNDIKGLWNGIVFKSNSSQNILDHVAIKHAGRTLQPGIDEIAAIGLDGNYLAKLTITNSSIGSGYGYGIVLGDNKAQINDNVEPSNQFYDLDKGHVLRK